MRENSETIYLTDGGHIENLGIYELLRRRCRLIIAVDAEADPEMSFRSLVALQRYARIDLGVLIYLPWAEIRDGDAQRRRRRLPRPAACRRMPRRTVRIAPSAKSPIRKTERHTALREIVDHGR